MRITFVGGPLDGQTEQQRGRGPIFRDDEGNTVPVAKGQRAWLHGRFVADSQARVYIRQEGLGDAGIVYVHATAWEDWHRQHRSGASAEDAADLDLARRLRDLARKVEGGSEPLEIAQALRQAAAELEDRWERRGERA